MVDLAPGDALFLPSGVQANLRQSSRGGPSGSLECWRGVDVATPVVRLVNPQDTDDMDDDDGDGSGVEPGVGERKEGVLSEAAGAAAAAAAAAVVAAAAAVRDPVLGRPGAVAKWASELSRRLAAGEERKQSARERDQGKQRTSPTSASASASTRPGCTTTTTTTTMTRTTMTNGLVQVEDLGKTVKLVSLGRSASAPAAAGAGAGAAAGAGAGAAAAVVGPEEPCSSCALQTVCGCMVAAQRLDAVRRSQTASSVIGSRPSSRRGSGKVVAVIASTYDSDDSDGGGDETGGGTPLGSRSRPVVGEEAAVVGEAADAGSCGGRDGAAAAVATGAGAIMGQHPAVPLKNGPHTARRQHQQPARRRRQSGAVQKRRGQDGVPANAAAATAAAAAAAAAGTAAGAARTAPGCDACPACADFCDDETCSACALKYKAWQSKQRGRGPAGRTYTRCMVRRHNTGNNGWLVAHGVVYDVTRYIASGRHPGGQGALLRHLAGDATEDFDFHSSKARKNVWSQFQIGKIESCPVADPNGGSAGGCTIS